LDFCQVQRDDQATHAVPENEERETWLELARPRNEASHISDVLVE
jgi:hypothetical protein